MPTIPQIKIEHQNDLPFSYYEFGAYTGGRSFSGAICDKNNIFWATPSNELNIKKLQWDSVSADWIITDIPHNKSGNFYGMVYDNDRYIWMATDTGPDFLRIDTTDGSLTSWPHGLNAFGNWLTGFFDGQSIWFIPWCKKWLTKINPSTGEMEHIDVGIGDPGTWHFYGAAYDSDLRNIWLAPDLEDYFLKFNTITREVTKIYHNEPSGTGLYDGGVYANGFIWMIPRRSAYIAKINPINNSITYITHGKGYGNNFMNNLFNAEQQFDGRCVWLAPYDSADLVRLDTTDGTIKSYPYGKTAGAAYKACLTDGRFVYLAPNNAKYILKFDSIKETFEAIYRTPVNNAFSNIAISRYAFNDSHTHTGKIILFVPNVFGRFAEIHKYGFESFNTTYIPPANESQKFEFASKMASGHLIEPVDPEWEFTPKRMFLVVADTNTVDANFTATTKHYKLGGNISYPGGEGNIGIAGLVVHLTSPDYPIQTVLSDANGYYSFSVQVGSFTVTVNDPTNSYAFDINDLPVEIVNNDSIQNDLIAKLLIFKLSGNVTLGGVGLENVTVNFGPGQSTLTDPTGYFEILNLHSGSYTIECDLFGYNFSPPNVVLDIIDADLIQNFTSTQIDSTIEGDVTVDGIPLSGIQIGLTGDSTQSYESDLNGHYFFVVPSTGSYTVTPSSIDYTFGPDHAEFNLSSYGIYSQNFTATAIIVWTELLPEYSHSQVEWSYVITPNYDGAAKASCISPDGNFLWTSPYSSSSTAPVVKFDLINQTYITLAKPSFVVSNTSDGIVYDTVNDKLILAFREGSSYLITLDPVTDTFTQTSTTNALMKFVHVDTVQDKFYGTRPSSGLLVKGQLTPTIQTVGTFGTVVASGSCFDQDNRIIWMKSGYNSLGNLYKFNTATDTFSIARSLSTIEKVNYASARTLKVIGAIDEVWMFGYDLADENLGDGHRDLIVAWDRSGLNMNKDFHLGNVWPVDGVHLDANTHDVLADGFETETEVLLMTSPFSRIIHVDPVTKSVNKIEEWSATAASGMVDYYTILASTKPKIHPGPIDPVDGLQTVYISIGGDTFCNPHILKLKLNVPGTQINYKSTIWPNQTIAYSEHDSAVVVGDRLVVHLSGIDCLMVFNLLTNALVGTANFIEGPLSFSGLVSDGTFAWLVPFNSPNIIKFNPADFSLTTVAQHNQGLQAFVGGGMVSYAGINYVFFAPYDSPKTCRVTTTTGALVTTTITTGAGLAKFWGCVVNGSSVFYAPYNGTHFMTSSYPGGTPSGVAVNSYGSFKGGYAGPSSTTSWFLPHNHNTLVNLSRTGTINLGRGNCQNGTYLTGNKRSVIANGSASWPRNSMTCVYTRDINGSTSDYYDVQEFLNDPKFADVWWAGQYNDDVILITNDKIIRLSKHLFAHIDDLSYYVA